MRHCAYDGCPIPEDADPRRVYGSQSCRNGAYLKRLRERRDARDALLASTEDVIARNADDLRRVFTDAGIEAPF